MVPLVFLGLGLYFLFAPAIKITSASYIYRPRTFIFGGVTIAGALLAIAASRVFGEGYAGMAYYISIFSYAVPVVLPIVAAFALKEPRRATTPSAG